jgi:hypothetical protein
MGVLNQLLFCKIKLSTRNRKYSKTLFKHETKQVTNYGSGFLYTELFPIHRRISHIRV